MESKGALLTVAIPLIAFKIWFAILLLTYAPTREGVVWIAATLVAIHAIYLLNPASEKAEFREKSLEALTLALNAGAQLGALGVVLHPGSALKSEDAPAAATRPPPTVDKACNS